MITRLTAALLVAAGCATTAPRPTDLTQVGVAEAARLSRDLLAIGMAIEGVLGRTPPPR